MVNTLSGSVCAYRKETVKPRFIRIDEVMALLDVTQDEAMDIALAAGARYQLAKIILEHKEIRKARGLFDTVLNCTRRRRTGNRHLGATAFRLSKTVP